MNAFILTVTVILNGVTVTDKTPGYESLGSCEAAGGKWETRTRAMVKSSIEINYKCEASR